MLEVTLAFLSNYRKGFLINMRVLIVGAGGFGKHHVVSLSQHEYELHIVDPSESARSELASNLNPRCRLYNSLDEIEQGSDFQFCIIATGASIRAQLFSHVRERFSVDKYLLEKVLFNSLEDYKVLNSACNSDIFVNYPRRAYPFYTKLKVALKKYDNLELLIEGGNNNILCNALHYIDLFEFITESKITRFTSCLYAFRESKRKGYVEASGVVKGQNSKGFITINNNLQKEKNRFTIKSNGKTLIEYIERDGVSYDGIDLCWEDDIVVQQSKLTNQLFSVELNCCPKMVDVIETNKSFIEMLLENDYFKGMKKVPIT